MKNTNRPLDFQLSPRAIALNLCPPRSGRAWTDGHPGRFLPVERCLDLLRRDVRFGPEEGKQIENWWSSRGGAQILSPAWGRASPSVGHTLVFIRFISDFPSSSCAWYLGECHQANMGDPPARRGCDVPMDASLVTPAGRVGGSDSRRVPAGGGSRIPCRSQTAPPLSSLRRGESSWQLQDPWSILDDTMTSELADVSRALS